MFTGAYGVLVAESRNRQCSRPSAIQAGVRASSLDRRHLGRVAHHSLDESVGFSSIGIIR
jgi:hypothetical protein